MTTALLIRVATTALASTESRTLNATAKTAGKAKRAHLKTVIATIPRARTVVPVRIWETALCAVVRPIGRVLPVILPNRPRALRIHVRMEVS